MNENGQNDSFPPATLTPSWHLPMNNRTLHRPENEEAHLPKEDGQHGQPKEEIKLSKEFERSAENSFAHLLAAKSDSSSLQEDVAS